MNAVIQSNQFNNLSVELTAAILVYTPPQQEVYHRPMEARLSGDMLNTCLELSQRNGGVIRPSTLTHVASQIIQPTMMPAAMVNIPHGLVTGRFSFHLELTIHSIYGVEKEYISGYTDTSEVSHGGYINPNMVFHIDSRMIIKEVEGVGVNGHNVLRKVTGDHGYLVEVPGNPNAISMRPEDIVDFQQHLPVTRTGVQTISARSTLLGITKFSNTELHVPSKYLAKALGGYLKANDATQHKVSDFSADSSYDFYRNAIDHMHNPTPLHDYLFNALGITEARASHCFTFKEINAAFPRANSFWQKILPNPNVQMISPLENTASWGSADIETVLVYSITHIIPSIMSLTMMNSLEVVMTNTGAGGVIDTRILNYTTLFKNIPVDQNYLIGQLELDIIHGLVLQRCTMFDLMMRVNLLGNALITISLDGKPPVTYNAPMFCSNRASPLIGLATDDCAELAYCAEYLASNIADVTTGHGWAVTPGMITADFINSEPMPPLAPQFDPLPFTGNGFSKYLNK